MVGTITKWIAGLVLAGIAFTVPAMAADEPEMSDVDGVAAITIYNSVCGPLPPKVRATRDQFFADMNQNGRRIKESGILFWLARSRANRAAWCAAFDFAQDGH